MKTNAVMRERVCLVLEVMPDPQGKAHGGRFSRPGDYRLRILLKWSLRGLGLRCVSVTPVSPPGDNPQDLTPEAARAA